jgi:capsular exopolysaccharide synthesis family protein
MQLDKKVHDLLIEKQAAAIVNWAEAGKIIKPASLPVNSSWPLGWHLILAGAAAGLFLSFPVLVLLGKLKKDTIHSKEEISEQSNLPFLCTVTDDKFSVAAGRTNASNLCTAVLMKSQIKFITFASNSCKEGKTFIATHLAQELAAVDKKVLLLDMNIDNPGISEYYSIQPDRTLSDVLEGNCDIHDAICLSTYPNLELLAPGNLTSGINSFLSSTKKDEILNNLKKHYDYIIVDTPSVSDNVDAVAMMKMSELNLFVVRANTTRKESLVAVEQLQKDYSIDNLHLVLNTKIRTTAKTGKINSRARDRKINIQTNKPSFVPAVLKKIALWFY